MITPVPRRYLGNQYGEYVFDGIKDAENLRQTLSGGFEELTFDTFISRLKNRQEPGGTAYQRIQRTNPDWLIAGYPGKYVVTDGNIMTTISAIEQETAFRAAVLAGTMVEIAPGKYAPTGSQADPTSATHVVVVQTPAGGTEEIPKEFWNEALRQLKTKGQALEKQYRI